MFGDVPRWTEEMDRKLIRGWNVDRLSSVELAVKLRMTPSQITGRMQRLRQAGVELAPRLTPIRVSRDQRQVAALARRPPIEAGNDLTWGCLNSLLPNVGPLVYNPGS